jgi:hypothetical protein
MFFKRKAPELAPAAKETPPPPAPSWKHPAQNSQQLEILVTKGSQHVSQERLAYKDSLFSQDQLFRKQSDAWVIDDNRWQVWQYLELSGSALSNYRSAFTGEADCDITVDCYGDTELGGPLASNERKINSGICSSEGNNFSFSLYLREKEFNTLKDAIVFALAHKGTNSASMRVTLVAREEYGPDFWVEKWKSERSVKSVFDIDSWSFASGL